MRKPSSQAFFMGRSFPCPVGSYRIPEKQVLLALFSCLFQPGGKITVSVLTSDSSQFVLLPQGLHHVSFHQWHFCWNYLRLSETFQNNTDLKRQVYHFWNLPWSNYPVSNLTLGQVRDAWFLKNYSFYSKQEKHVKRRTHWLLLGWVNENWHTPGQQLMTAKGDLQA